MITSQTDRAVARRTRDDPRWARIVARDPSADGAVWFAVTTTGVYCRPSCPARRPRPENALLFSTREEAERRGFRPCRRCRPDGPSPAERRAEAVAEACRALAGEAPPSVAALAERAGMSPSAFRRAFRAATGATPRAWAAAARAERMRDEVREAPSVSEAVHAAGFETASRFYAATDASLGMTPGAYRRGGDGETIRFAVGAASLGAVLVAEGSRGVCAILLGDDPEALVRDLEARFPQAALTQGDAAFERRVAEVVALVERPGLGHELPLDLRGTAFQVRVWRALLDIPPGETASYAEIARRIGAPTAARAVAGACGANALAVAVPCHRVVRVGGGISGYRWGVDRKRELLTRERRERED